MKLTVKIQNLIFYTLFWTLVFLLGNYIGGYFRLVYIFLTLILISNLIHYITSINSINYYQQFSTEHPQKGQNIEYKLTIENYLPITPCFIEISFNDNIKLDNLNPKIKNTESEHIYSNFYLPYRGIYDVGIKNIVCRDILNIFEFKLSFWPRTFYVYPMINKNIYSDKNGSGENKNNSIFKDNKYTDYLDSIDKYIPGSKMSQISWKHLASRGEPYIRKYLSEEGQYTYIFLDCTTLPAHRLGPTDDLSIETALSIISKNIENNRETKINICSLPITNETDFKKLYKDSINIKFDQTVYETELNYKTQNYKESDRIILITTFESNFFFDLDYIKNSKKLTIYIITTNLDPIKQEQLSKMINKLSELVEIICIK
ncbi:MAG: DUF58 domain-containing protein [Spirochaetaceae bacterium]